MKKLTENQMQNTLGGSLLLILACSFLFGVGVGFFAAQTA